MKKTNFTILSFFLLVNQAYGQCQPVFRNMSKQPPKPKVGYLMDASGSTFYNSYSTGKTLIYASQTKINQSMTDYTTSFQIWDDTNWITLKETKFVTHSGYKSLKLLTWKNRLLGIGYIKSFDSISAAAGNYFYILEYKNHHWDTLPGCSFPDTSTFANYTHITATSDGLFLYHLDNNYKLNNKAYVYRYDESSLQFVKIFDLKIKSSFPNIQTGKNRLLINNVFEVNGNSTNGFAIYENDSLKLIQDTMIPSAYEYSIDNATDNIYGLCVEKKNQYFIYSNKLEGFIQTIEDLPYTSYSQTIIHNGTFHRLIYNNGNYYATFCSGQNKWKHIYLNGIENGFTPIISTKGVYGFNYSTQKVMELTEGTLIQGRLFLDADSNCNFNPLTDVPLKNTSILFTSNVFIAGAKTDDSGKYQLFVIEDTINIKSVGNYSSCMDTNLIVSNNTNIHHDISIKFPQKYNIKSKLFGGFSIRLNTRNSFMILIENTGPPIDTVFFEFQKDLKATFLPNQDSTITGISGNTANGYITNLGYYEQRKVFVQMDVPFSNAKFGDTLLHTIKSIIQPKEIDLSDNTDTLKQLAIYSRDPNYKECNTSKIPATKSSKIDYYIGFQNEGNDDAFDVVIHDTLSSKFILDSIKILNASHNYSYTLDNNILIISFKNIHLKPKSVSETLSMGAIRFSIFTKEGLNEGDSITNTASIFFDLNDAIITNTTVVRVPKSTELNSIIEKQQTSLTAYPNPTQTMLNIQTTVDSKIEVYNSIGELIFTGFTYDGKLEIKTDNWSSGLYVLRNETSTIKILKTN